MRERIRARRLELRLSMQMLANLSGLDASHIEDIETGRIVNPRIDTVAAIAGSLGSSIDSLFYGRCGCA